MTPWQHEARGIEPWHSARVLDVGTGRAYTALYADPLYILNTRIPAWTVWSPDGLEGFATDILVLDLSDPDTLAAFDRRLALRLGASEEAVREGVQVFREGNSWTVAAGVFKGYGDNWLWFKDTEINVDCHILARVRVWNSVTP